MSNVKQVIVMRKDLNMRKGKMIAQGAHASMKVFFDQMKQIDDKEFYFMPSDEEVEWINGIFTKICLSCNSEQELLDLYQKAKEAKLTCALITDSGLTEFKGIPTNTCIAIGPAKAEDIDRITGSLSLL